MEPFLLKPEKEKKFLAILSKKPRRRCLWPSPRRATQVWDRKKMHKMNGEQGL